MTKNFWDKFKKPWTKEQCEKRYVQGDRISLRQLAIDSGRPEKTLEYWSSTGPRKRGEPSWSLLRTEFHGKIQNVAEEKAIDLLSDRLAEDMSALVLKHYEGYKIFRELSLTVGTLLLNRLNSIEEPEYREAEAAKISPIGVNFWSLVFDRSVKGERDAMCLKYHDVNEAIKAVQAAGFELEIPDEGNVDEYLTRATVDQMRSKFKEGFLEH